MRDHEEEIERAGGRVAAVGLGGFGHARAFREETGIDFPLLVDVDKRAYEAVGLRRAGLLDLIRRDNGRARARALAAGHRQHRLGKDPLQLGGSFVFAPGDRDLYAHSSETFGDTAPVGELLRALDAES